MKQEFRDTPCAGIMSFAFLFLADVWTKERGGDPDSTTGVPCLFDRHVILDRTGRAKGEDVKMNRRIFALALGLGLAAFLAPRFAMAEDHLVEAIGHTKQAISVGEAGDADGLVVHAEAALTHADAALKEKANPHTTQGITHLNAAIAEGKKKDAKAATGHAEEALTHLQAATK
jgi:Small metal-binding protein